VYRGTSLIRNSLGSFSRPVSRALWWASLSLYLASSLTHTTKQVWEGNGVVAAGRVILGATKPSESAPGTVRGDYAIDVGRNVCHGSDAVRPKMMNLPLGNYSWRMPGGPQ